MDPNIRSIEVLASSDIDMRQETLPPNNQEEECATVDNKITAKCKCNLTYCDLDYARVSIVLWRPLDWVVCENCFWGDTELTIHQCMSRKINMEQQSKNVFSDTKSFNELYNIYRQEHANGKYSNKAKFNFSIHKLLYQNQLDMAVTLLNKDQNAHSYFAWNGRYK